MTTNNVITVINVAWVTFAGPGKPRIGGDQLVKTTRRVREVCSYCRNKYPLQTPKVGKLVSMLSCSQLRTMFANT